MTPSPKPIVKKKTLFNDTWRVLPHRITTEMAGARGEQRLYKFKNGHGASVVKFGWPFVTTGEFSWMHDGDATHWELGVIKWTGKSYKLTYDTPITDNVIGHLTKNEVEKILNKIKNL